MSCLTEFKCAVYADGELPEEEGREVTRHLASCGACRRIVASLRFERSALIQCLQDTDLIEFELEDPGEALRSPKASPLSLAQFTAFVLAMAVLLRPVFAALGEFDIPLSASAQFNLLIDAVMYGIPSALDSINAFLNIASWVVVCAMASITLFVLFRKSPVISTLISVLTLLTVFSPWTYAIDVRRGEKPVNVPAGETIDDTLVVMGESAVDIDGTVNGDLITGARNVRIKGTVKGNLVSFAQRIEIDGTVEGSVVGTGGFVEIRGKVGRNLYGLAGSVTIGPEGRIDGDASILAGETTLEGAVGRDFYAYSVGLSQGDSPRNTLKYSLFSHGGAVQVLPQASIGRNLFIKVDDPASAIIETGAKIGGRNTVEIRQPRVSKYATASFYVWQTIWLAAAFIAGLIFLSAFPAFRNIRLDTGGDLLLTAGVGLAVAVVPPVAAVIACLTLVGLPLGLATVTLWIASLYLAKIVIAAFLGRSLLKSNTAPKTPLLLLTGLVPVFIAVNLPIVGGVIQFLLVLLGLGTLAMTVYQLATRNNPSGSVAALTA